MDTTNGALLWKIEKIIKKGDYLYAIVRDHPKANKNGYVLLHRIVMENHLKRPLNSNEVVHHIDGNRKNNSIENLQVFTASEHSKLHQSRTGRLWVELKCPNCSKVFYLPKNHTHLNNPKQHYTCCSRHCRGVLSRNIQLHRETEQVEKAISENIIRVYRKFNDNSEQTE